MDDFFFLCILGGYGFKWLSQLVQEVELLVDEFGQFAFVPALFTRIEAHSLFHLLLDILFFLAFQMEFENFPCLIEG